MGDPTNPGIPANLSGFVGSYDPKTLGPDDLAVVVAPSVSGPTTGLYPIVAFADNASAASFFRNNRAMTLVSATPDDGASGNFLAMEPDGFDSTIKTQNGDSGGAAISTFGGVGYISGIVSSSYGQQSTDVPVAPTIFSDISVGQYDTIMGLIPTGTNFGDLAPDLLYGSSPAEVIRGSQRKADIITNGDGDVIAAGSGGGLLNTETGQGDVVFLPSAVGETDSGTTVVVSPGITTLVGGGADDKLVLLADRVGDGSGQPSGPSALSDASDTVQLLGGFDLYGSAVPSYMGYYYQGDSSLGPRYDATYTMQGDDLVIGINPADGSWDSEICIKNYAPGDFGLTFSGSSDADQFYDGTESAEDFEHAKETAIKKLTAQPQASSAIDDDPSVSWQDQLPVSLYGDSIDTVPPPVSDVTIAADLQAVLSDDGGDAPPFDPQDPSAPSIAGATAAQATTAEAPLTPFSGVTVADANAGADDTITIMQLGGEGVLAGDGLAANPDGTYTLAAADPATITAELQSLTFTPDAGAAGTKSTTILTLTDRSSAGRSATDTTTTVTDISAGPPLSSIAIGGTQATQTTADLPVELFAGVTIADSNAGVADTLTIAMSGSGGTLSGEGLTANPDGTYTLAAADPSGIVKELAKITFTPTAGSAGGQPATTVFTLTARNSAGDSAVDGTAAVTDVPAVPIAITGTQAGQVAMAGVPWQPFSGVTVADGNANTTDALTIALTGLGGTLAGYGLTANPDGTYTLAAADPATATYELQALTFTSNAASSDDQSTTTFTLTDQSDAGVGATDATISVRTAAVVSISGAQAGQATTDEAAVTPFAGVTIADGNAGATDTVTIDPYGGGGTLSGSGLVANPDGTYTLAAADPATLTAELQALTFTPAAPVWGTQSTTDLSLMAQSSAGPTVWDYDTSVTDTSMAVSITGTQAGETTTAEAPIAPFAYVDLADGTAGASDAVTITLSGGGGTLSGAGLFADLDGSYSLAAADPATVTAELQALTFTPAVPVQGSPATTTLTLFDQSSSGRSASDAATTVTDLQPPQPVTITGVPSAQATAAEVPLAPFADATIADGNAGATDTVYIGISGVGGMLSGAGLTATPYGYYSLDAADPATVTTELQGLVFTPAAPASGASSDTTLFVEDVSSVSSNPAVIFTDVIDTPAGGAASDAGRGSPGPAGAGGVLQAGPGTVTLQAPDGTASLTAGAGDDTFYGGDGSDTFVYTDQSGNLTVSDLFQSGWGDNVNTLSLTSHGPGDVSFSQKDDDLLIAIAGSDKAIDVAGEFDPSTKDGVDRIQFSNGTVWSRSDIGQRTQR